MEQLCLDQDKQEVLREAAAAGDTAKVRSLLSLGADPNAADSEGWTALHWSSNNAALVTLLLQNGAAVDAADAQGKSTLHWAATDGYTGMLNLVRCVSCGGLKSTRSNNGADYELAALHVV